MTPTPRALRLLNQLLAMLRALQWSHWTAHWVSRGYDAHLLFERLYKATEEEIDTLGEKLVGAGYDLQADLLMSEAQRYLALHPLPTGPAALYDQALALETHLQDALAQVQGALEEEGVLGLGLDDYLAATANAHETALYLLRQARRGMIAP